jgi:hypothetical protein
MGALCREGLDTIAAGPGPFANATPSTVAAISFPELPGPPGAPGPPSATEPDGSSPTPPVGVPARDRLLGVGVVVVLFAVLAATAGWRVMRDDTTSTAAFVDPTGQPGPSTSTPSTTPTEDQWPVEVQPLVAFVEQHRGGNFDHPVPITYLSEADYQAAATTEAQDPANQDPAADEAFVGQLRSLGLAGQSLDLGASTEQLYGEGTLAFYDPEANEIKVLGTDLDVAHRVTLVHELTHAWQDQRGFLDKLDELDDTEAYTLQALAEGDAMRIEDEYVDTLSNSERDAYDSQSSDQAGESDLSGIPDVLVAAFSSPYVLGAPYVKVLDDQGGNSQIDAAMADPPPAEADLMVVRRYLDGVQPVAVDEPSVPAGAERLDGAPFGAVSWLMTLSERIDPRDALDLVDRWAGDQSVVYRQDGRTCTAAAYRGQTPADTDLAATRIGQWAQSSPALDASVERAGDVAVLRSCEAAAGDEDIVGRAQTALQYPAIRTEITWELLDAGSNLDDAICFADAVVDNLTVDDVESGAYSEADRIAQLSAVARTACSLRTG